jgi:hypothetical protein
VAARGASSRGRGGGVRYGYFTLSDKQEKCFVKQFNEINSGQITKKKDSRPDWLLILGLVKV